MVTMMHHRRSGLGCSAQYPGENQLARPSAYSKPKSCRRIGVSSLP
eukprot:SAG22_NODE_6760_length_814_cov_2.258741_1_plen_45_part_10